MLLFPGDYIDRGADSVNCLQYVYDLQQIYADAKTEGVEITREIAKSYMTVPADVELDEAALKNSPVVTAMRWMAVW